MGGGAPEGGCNPYFKILDLSKLFVADAMKKSKKFALCVIAAAASRRKMFLGGKTMDKI